jgi:hypothetical protein
MWCLNELEVLAQHAAEALDCGVGCGAAELIDDAVVDLVQNSHDGGGGLVLRRWLHHLDLLVVRSHHCATACL